jgi:hypothetical protein
MKRERCRIDARKEQTLYKVLRGLWTLRVRSVAPKGLAVLSNLLLFIIMIVRTGM